MRWVETFVIWCAIILGMVFITCAHDSDTVKNCKERYETTLLNGIKIRCIVVKE